MKRKGYDLICRELKSDWTDMFMYSPNSYWKPVCLRYPINSDSGKGFRHKKVGALDTQKSFFTKANEHSKSTVFVSYEIALILARKKKPITDAGEIIKPTLKIAAGMLDDKNCEKKFDQIPLSNNMMTRRVEEMAIDESNDISHTHQVTVFFGQLTITLLILKNYKDLRLYIHLAEGEICSNILKI
ncbi:hypothetical protein RF11_01906 [Thelohanellus kitauei]|uniref:Uncharacterized protein n=1 Tax=Thelohanellus kitauei TaxID=669202 RepID=A0A0C2MQS6_THEKT|nr:hypothetical protein RF11_01906 [Thelohanellus kitauei]